MRVGLQTICWGDRLKREHWKELLPLIRDAGYEGIEVFQDPDPKNLPPYPELAELCSANKLELLGFSGGDLPRRLRYLRGDDWRNVPKPQHEPYLYVESAETDFSEALTAGFRLALHYHHLSRLRTINQALEVLRDNPGLFWLPDTAHLFISRQQTDVLIKLLTDPDLVPRTCAIHLKDWAATFGRFSQSYARGFCMPGKGDLKLNEVVQALQKNSGTRDQWAIVELDYTSEGDGKDVAEAGATVLKWLNKPLPKAPPLFTVPEKAEEQPLPDIAGKLLRMAAVQTEGFFDAAARLIQQHFPAAEIFLCGVLTEQALVTVRGWAPRPEQPTPVSDEGRKLAKREGKKALVTRTFSLDSENKVAALPVFNCFNPHAVRHVLVFRWDDSATEAEIRQRYDLPELSRAVAMALDIHIGHRCRVMSLRAGRVAAIKDTRRDVLDGVAELIREELRCDGVSVFVVNGARDRLVEGGSTGLQWRDESQQDYYTVGRGKTGKVAEERSYAIHYHSPAFPRDEPDEPVSRETDVADPSIDSVLATAFFDQNEQVAGVVRCRNPYDKTNVLYFSEDDLALVEAAMMAVQPELETFAQYETASTGHTALVHEIRQPIFAIRGAVARTKWHIKNYTCSDTATPRPAHFLDSVNTYLDIINEQAAQYKYFVDRVLQPPKLDLRKAKFFGDIVAPAVASFYPRFQKESLPRNVDYGDESMWHQVPWVLVDRNSMFQVVFNLLSNAIKYRKSNPNDFSIRIWGERDGREAVIHFEDNGIGIPCNQRDRVFARGGRIVDDPTRDTIPGFGIGLWVARSIMGAHDGSIDLTECGSDRRTRFTIRLPEYRG